MSTGKFDPRRVLVLQRLATAWDKAPTKTLGELIDAALFYDHKILGTITDAELIEAVERYVLLHASK